MNPPTTIPPRKTAATGVALIAAAVLIVARPSRGQQPTPQPTPTPRPEPVVQLTAPATADGGATTQVNYNFPLPAGLSLQRNPRVRVIDAQGQVTELLPMYISQQTPTWAGFRGLHTESYPPEVYRVSVEVDYARADGTTAIAAIPLAPLAVPDQAGPAP